MRKLLVPFIAAFALLMCSSAQAVTYEYCAHSLRGGGTLAPDNDIRQEWDRIQSHGYDLVSAYAEQWYGPSGAWSVQVRYVFIRRNGYAFRVYFGCWGSGSGYGDARE